MTAADTLYRVRNVDLDGEKPLVLSLWKRGLSDPSRQSDRFDWLYGAGPGGAGRIMLLSGRDGEPIGVKGIVPRDFEAGGRQFRGGLLADFVIDPAHRTGGPGLHLARNVLENSRKRFDIVYGFPNRAAAAVYRRAGYRPFGSLARYVLPLRSSEYLATRIKGVSAALLGSAVDGLTRIRLAMKRRAVGSYGWWDGAIDDSFDRLWQKAARYGWIIGRRDVQFLRWRFIEHPRAHFRIFTLRSRGASGSLTGYAVTRAKGANLEISDLLVRSPDEVTPLLAALALQAHREGFRALDMEFAGDLQVVSRLRRLGFREREARQIFAMLLPDVAGWQKRFTWYWTSADEDG